MGGNGGDNAHNNAFGGGKNPGIGSSGSGNQSGSSGNSGNSGGSSGGGMRAPTASEVAGQYNSYGGTQITASQVSNIRSDGEGGYKADIQGAVNNVSSGGGGHTSSTLGGFSGVPTSGNGNNQSSGSGGNGNNGSSDSGKGETTSGPGWSSDAGKAGTFVPTNKDKLIKGLIKSIDDHSTSETGSYTIHYTGGAVATVTVPGGNLDKMNVHYDIGGGPASGNQLTRDAIKSLMAFRAETKAKAKAEADVKAAAEAKAKAEVARKAEEARKALFAKAGIPETPVYTPEMVKAANTMLAASAAMMLNRAPAGIQLSAVGEGVITAIGEWAGFIAGALWRGAVAVAEAATASTVGVTVGAFVIGFIPLSAGHSSDSKVPGRDISMMAAQARLFTAGKVSIEPGMKSINLPVRGFISTDSDGRQSVNFVKTGAGGVSATVQVLSAVRDKVTGLDKITVPAVAGAPSRTILVNPVPVGPAAPSHTGNSAPVPVTPVHTGTEVKQADSIVTTTYPAADIPPLQDFIYWQPDAIGTGVEPVYVMLSSPRDLPGKASGKGEKVGEKWLNIAGKELGAPIPSQIADKLRGKEFANFDAFRKAIWAEVGKESELLKQFKSQNKTNVKKGKSPFVPESGRVGGRQRFELHHVKQIKDNGAVYDIDNIRVMTPKRHIEIHKGDK